MMIIIKVTRRLGVTRDELARILSDNNQVDRLAPLVPAVFESTRVARAVLFRLMMSTVGLSPSCDFNEKSFDESFEQNAYYMVGDQMNPAIYRALC